MARHGFFYYIDALILKIRRAFFFIQRSKYRYVGSGIQIYGVFSCHAPYNVSIGNNVSINDYVYINGAGGIVIGDNVALSAGCKIITTKLDSNCFLNERKYINKGIVIGNNVQIGAGAVVLPGVSICDNVIIGASAVVSRSIDTPGIYVGIPAKCTLKFESEKTDD